MNELIKSIIDTLKKLNGEAKYEDIYGRIGVDFPSKNVFDNSLLRMVKSGIIDKIEIDKNIKLRSGLGVNEEKYVDIRLTIDEAILLYDFLLRVNEKDITTIIQDQSEQRILWNVECYLEKILPEPFQPEYEQIVQIARSRFRDDK